MAFSSTIPPLQVALSFACSVDSLSHSPSFQLPGWRSLHRYSLANYVIGWGQTSSCTRRYSVCSCMSIYSAIVAHMSDLPTPQLWARGPYEIEDIAYLSYVFACHRHTLSLASMHMHEGVAYWTLHTKHMHTPSHANGGLRGGRKGLEPLTN